MGLSKHGIAQVRYGKQRSDHWSYECLTSYKKLGRNDMFENIKLTKSQEKIVTCAGNSIVLGTHRTGKTFAGQIKALLVSNQYPGSVLMLTDSMHDVKWIIGELERIAEDRIKEINRLDNIVELKNGSSIMVGLHNSNVDQLASQSVNAIIIDNARNMTPEDYLRVIRWRAYGKSPGTIMRIFGHEVSSMEPLLKKLFLGYIDNGESEIIEMDGHYVQNS